MGRMEDTYLGRRGRHGLEPLARSVLFSSHPVSQYCSDPVLRIRKQQGDGNMPQVIRLLSLTSQLSEPNPNGSPGAEVRGSGLRA